MLFQIKHQDCLCFTKTPKFSFWRSEQFVVLCTLIIPFFFYSWTGIFEASLVDQSFPFIPCCFLFLSGWVQRDWGCRSDGALRADQWETNELGRWIANSHTESRSGSHPYPLRNSRNMHISVCVSVRLCLCPSVLKTQFPRGFQTLQSTHPKSLKADWCSLTFTFRGKEKSTCFFFSHWHYESTQGGNWR